MVVMFRVFLQKINGYFFALFTWQTEKHSRPLRCECTRDKRQRSNEFAGVRVLIGSHRLFLHFTPAALTVIQCRVLVTVEPLLSRISRHVISFALIHFARAVGVRECTNERAVSRATMRAMRLAFGSPWHSLLFWQFTQQLYLWGSKWMPPKYSKNVFFFIDSLIISQLNS